MGRATFYRNFDTPTNVLHMKCDSCFEEVLTGFPDIYDPDEHERSSFLTYFFSYRMEHSELLEAIDAINRFDIISECHFRRSQIITAFFRPDKDMNSKDYIYFMAMRTGIMTGILSARIKTGKKKNAEELTELLINLYYDISGADMLI